MTSEDSTLQNQECCGDAAAYVLGALVASEAAEFRRHLEMCIVCRDELDAFEPIADGLALAAPWQPATHGLRRETMRDVRAEPRTAPRPDRARPRTDRARPNPRDIRYFPFSRRLAARPTLVGGLLAAAALALIGGYRLGSSDSTGVRVIQARVNGPPGSARVIVTSAGAELSVSHLPPPSTGRVYELWVERDGHGPSPMALLSVNASGAGELSVPGGLRGVRSIMVTQERAGGSLVPTQPPVILATVSQE